MDVNEKILQYFQGRLSIEETRVFEEILEASPEMKSEIEAYRYIWNLSDTMRRQQLINTESNWRKLSKRLYFYRIQKNLWGGLQKVAVILLIPLILVSIYLYENKDKDKTHKSESIEVFSAYGLVSRITLPDGSTVWLNSGTRITYPQSFENGKRQVFLSGEAYFEVKSDPKNRFDVITPDGITVSAYGTKFDVCAYHDDNYTDAILVNGHVEVRKAGMNTSMLLSGQQASINRGDERLNFNVSRVNIYEKTAWKDGKMVFRRAGFKEIATKLSRKFNAEIILQGKTLYDYEYTATFTVESLSEILSLLEKSAPIKCSIIESEKQSDDSFSKKKVIICEKK